MYESWEPNSSMAAMASSKKGPGKHLSTVMDATSLQTKEVHEFESFTLTQSYNVWHRGRKIDVEWLQTNHPALKNTCKLMENVNNSKSLI
jgi:hypothetical protein